MGSGSPSRHPAAPQWAADGSAPVCRSCWRPFSLARRRHHCRSCGDVFCTLCSSFLRPLPHLGYPKDRMLRVCAGCAFPPKEAVDLEAKLLQSWAEIKNVGENEKHHYPLNSLAIPISQAMQQGVKLSGCVLEHSISLLNELIQVRYLSYHKEIKAFLSYPFPPVASVHPVSPNRLLDEVKGFMRFLKRIPGFLQPQLKYEVPPMFQRDYNTLKIRYREPCPEISMAIDLKDSIMHMISPRSAASEPSSKWTLREGLELLALACKIHYCYPNLRSQIPADLISSFQSVITARAKDCLIVYRATMDSTAGTESTAFKHLQNAAKVFKKPRVQVWLEDLLPEEIRDIFKESALSPPPVPRVEDIELSRKERLLEIGKEKRLSAMKGMIFQSEGVQY